MYGQKSPVRLMSRKEEPSCTEAIHTLIIGAFMEYTGERYLPWEKNAQASYEHYHRYIVAAPFTKGKKVLDLASGEGYGTALLAGEAAEIIGVDIDPQAIAVASSQYIRSNLKFLQGSILDIPIKDQIFDVITCFEAIEHVGEQEKVLDEALRLLSDDGLLIISTPNKLVFTDEADEPWPWHVKEFYYSEFREFLEKKFDDVIFLGQRVINGSAIWPLDIPAERQSRTLDEILVQKQDKGVEIVDASRQKPMFFLAIAAKHNLDELRNQLGSKYLIDVSLSLLNEKNQLIDKLQKDVGILDRMVRDKDIDLVNLTGLVESKQIEIVNSTRDVAQLNQALVQNEREIIDLKDVYERQIAEFMDLKDVYEHQKAELINQLQATDVYIQQKEQDIRIALSALEEVQRSFGWRLVQRYRNLMYRLAPVGSFQRKLYKFLLHPKTALRQSQAQQVIHSTDDSVTLAGTNMAVSSQQPRDYAVCTIASKNYLSSVRVFAHSVRKTNPDIAIYVLLVDRVDGVFDPTGEPFQVITLDELNNIPDPQHFKFKYTPIELNTAAKPYFLEYLFDKFNLEKVCYFDPDIYVFHSLQGLWELLNGYSMILTPHITQPYTDDRKPSELEINLAGIFNLGFIGISDTQTTRAFLQWWKERMYDYCFMVPGAGMHVDQNWVNFAPVMRDGVFILRDPAYNIAYWNLHYRGKRLRFLGNERLLIDDRPVVFFHFSGLPINDLDKISKHQNRYTLNDFPNIKPLLEWYSGLLLKNGYKQTYPWTYAYGYFDNGVSIPFFARDMYNRLDASQQKKFGNPFDTAGEYSFFYWLNQPVDGNNNIEPKITRLHMEIYRARPDLQSAFPEPLGKDRIAFWNWLCSGGVSDHSLDMAFIPMPAGQTFREASMLLKKIKSFSKRVMMRVRNELKDPAKRLFANNSKVMSRLRAFDQRYFDLSVSTDVNKPDVAHALILPVSPVQYPFGVNVAGYIQGEFGVAEVARASINALESSNVPYALNNVRASIHRHQDKTFDNFTDKNPYAINLVHVNADQVPVFAHEKNADYFKGRYNIGYWFWELSKFPHRWQSSFERFQEIWVASTFCQESIARLSPIPVVKMTFPVLVDEMQVLPKRLELGLPEDKFLYLFSYDYLSIFERKNPLGVLRAFRMVFDKKNDVALVLKSINSEYAPEQMEILKREAKDLPVYFLDGHLTQQDMISLIASCDSYISLHRSEGFGLGLAQAMYMGKPAIATGYSGNMEFMNHNNSFLVRYNLTELLQDCGPYEKGNVWAEPDIDHAAELMQAVYLRTGLSQKLALQGQKDIKNKMTPVITGREMVERINLIMAKR